MKDNQNDSMIKSNQNDKKLQNYSPRLGTVIFEAFSLRKRNSMRYTTRQQFQEKKKQGQHL